MSNFSQFLPITPVANGGTGLTSAGTSGNVLTSNGTGFISSAPVTNSTNFVASGAISSAGLVVGLNANGTVSVISASVTTPSVGSEYVFSSVSSDAISSCYDSVNNKIIIAYTGTSTYGTCIVGTVSGTSISFGTPVIFVSAATGQTTIVYDITSGKSVIFYKSNVNAYGYGIVGTVSGTSISFGTAVNFITNIDGQFSAIYANAQSKIVVTIVNGNTGQASSMVATISGTSISFGGAANLPSGSITNITSCYDTSTQKFVVFYRYSGATLWASVGTISWTSTRFGTAINAYSSDTTGTARNSATFDSINNKAIIIFNNNAGNVLMALVGTISGTSISFGTVVTVFSGTVYRSSTTFSSGNGKVIVCYGDGTTTPNYYGKVTIGTVSGNSISFSNLITFNAGITYCALTNAYDSIDETTILSYVDASNSGYGTSIVFDSGLSNKATRIGIAQNSAINGASVTVKLPYQIDTNQTGLTAGSTYYVSNAGALTTTSTGNSLIGKALSATNLLITSWGA